MSNPTPRTILHVDINSYFATLLQQENPQLRGRPLGILKDAGRTCIIAASIEAKKYGVKTGSRLRDARERCPELITLPAQFDRYLDATKRLQRIFKTIAPDVYIYSLDEAFIDITDCRQHLYPDPLIAAHRIQEAIQAELGEWVSCSVGIGENRFLAKMASETCGKHEIMRVTVENRDQLIATAPFEDVCGVGHALQKKLARMGIDNLYLLRFYSEEELLPIFGPFWTRQLQRMSLGQEPHHLQLLDDPEHIQKPMQSVGRSITGFRTHSDEEEIKTILRNLIEEVTHKVRQMDMAGRRVSFTLYGSNQQYGERNTLHNHRTLQYHIRHSQEMFDIIWHELYDAARRPREVIKFAVRLGLLSPESEIDQSLLPSSRRHEKISRAQDAINKKYGLFTLRSGSLLDHEITRPEVTGFLGDRQYHGLGT